jgi:hypothetical protein
MRIACLIAAGAAASAWTSAAWAHVDLTYPPMRHEYSNNGQKTGPCGSGPATGAVTTFGPGATITVTWDETINHPGHYRISFDADGGDDDFVDPSGYDDFYVAPSVVADDIPDMGGNSFSQQITLPETECDLCTIQLIQVMTDKPPWGPGGGDDIYYWCADIAIKDGGGSGGAPNNTGGSGSGGNGASGQGGAGNGSGGDSSASGSSAPITATSDEGGGCSFSAITSSPAPSEDRSHSVLLAAMAIVAAACRRSLRLRAGAHVTRHRL